MSSSEGVDLMHVVRICRERCADAGYSGDAFHECVKRCVEEERRRGG